MDKIVITNRKELEELIREAVAKEVKKQLADLKQKPVNEQLVSVKQLCEQLNTTRQTINNWRKSSKTDYLINPFIHRAGGKVLYDIAGIRQVINDHETSFGNNREYQYKYDASASDATKNDDRFKAIQGKIMLNRQHDLSEDDRIFYEQECKWRGERSRLQ